MIYNITVFQKKVLDAILFHYKTCSDIAWDIKSTKMAVGGAIKKLDEKNLISTMYDYPNNPKYLAKEEKICSCAINCKWFGASDKPFGCKVY